MDSMSPPKVKGRPAALSRNFMVPLFSLVRMLLNLLDRDKLNDVARELPHLFPNQPAQANLSDHGETEYAYQVKDSIIIFTQ